MKGSGEALPVSGDTPLGFRNFIERFSVPKLEALFFLLRPFFSLATSGF